MCKILQQEVVINKDAKKAQELLLQTRGIAAFHNALRTADEKEHFVRHLRQYIDMWLPNCPFEVCTTNRYTITTAEACVIARKVIRKGERIPYLRGMQVEMTEQEEQELTGNTDFSIVITGRRKRPSLFLGPARFANHDCNSNAKLHSVGAHEIHIIAKRNISPLEEITVSYGTDYFGIDNCECLCHTCETKQVNGWDPRGPILHEDSSDEESSEDEESESVTPEKPRAGPSRSNKRRRQAEDDEPMRRGPGRPRKYPRPDDQLIDDEDEEKWVDATGNVRDGRGRFKPKKSSANSTPMKGKKLGTPQTAPVKSRNLAKVKKQDPDEPLMDRIFRLLGGVADRADRRQRGLSANDPIHITPPEGSEAEVEEAQEEQQKDEKDDDDDEDEETDSSVQKVVEVKAEVTSNNRTVVRGRGGMFVRKTALEKAIEKRDAKNAAAAAAAAAAQETAVTAPKSRLPSIKKERSFSSLRHVVTAEDSIYSIPTSEADEPPRKRGPGRPRKHPRPESESASPSSMGTDNSSSASSLASSATSLETFANGNIAQGICDMLTTEIAPRGKAVRTTRVSVTETETVVRQPKLSRVADEDSQSRAVVRRSTRGVVDVTTAPVTSIENEEDDDEDGVQRGEPRTPGDYHMCKALLATTYHRWVECRNCDEFFVQPEAFLTRIACPRCERHSKLYGYYWPKTDREGPHDTEERVLDHRTIHRYIDPEEERQERKGRKTLAELLRDKELSESRGSEESESPEQTTKITRSRQLRITSRLEEPTPVRSDSNSKSRRLRADRMTM